MENIRLIYEQIEVAKHQLLAGGVLDCRLALILLDNVAELLMVRALEERFGFDDYFHPPGAPERWVLPDDRKYTAEERAKAKREFEPKLRIVGFKLGLISPEERAVLKVCHRLRCEAFHAGILRSSILRQTALLLFRTTVALTLKLPLGPYVIPYSSDGPDAEFLRRFELRDGMQPGLDEGKKQIANKLVEGIDVDAGIFAETLSRDLLERIEENLFGSLSTLAGERDDLDHNLQHTQFWRDRGIPLAKAGVRGPQLDDAFQQWKAEGKAKYTIKKIEGWRRQATAIADSKNPANALDRWWAIDDKIQPLESELIDAVIGYDDDINMRIHDG